MLASFRIVSLPGNPGGLTGTAPRPAQEISKKTPLFLLPRPISSDEQRAPFPTIPVTYPASFSEDVPFMASMHLREKLLSQNDHANESVRKSLLWEYQIIRLTFCFKFCSYYMQSCSIYPFTCYFVNDIAYSPAK